MISVNGTMLAVDIVTCSIKIQSKGAIAVSSLVLSPDTDWNAIAANLGKTVTITLSAEKNDGQ